MNDLIILLKEMGARDVKYIEENGCDDALTFTFKDKTAIIYGVHYNDSTGGLSATVDKGDRNDA